MERPIHTLIDVTLLAFMIAVAVAVVRLRSLFAVAMLSGIFSLSSAALFVLLGAVDVAFTEASVGAGISTVLMLATLALTGREEARPRRPALLPLAVVGATTALLLYGTADMPPFGDPQAPTHMHVVPRYIEKSEAETNVINVVTSVLASYRGYDTLGETTVIFTAGIGVLLLLGATSGATPEPQGMRHFRVLRIVAKMLTPLILLFALYVQSHGDLSPGGGFQAGVIFAVGFILYGIVFGVEEARRSARPGLVRAGIALGVLLYGGVGVIGLLLGRNYLDYSVLAAEPAHGHELGIGLVELGVGITVASVMVAIFFSFADRGAGHGGTAPR